MQFAGENFFMGYDIGEIRSGQIGYLYILSEKRCCVRESTLLLFYPRPFILKKSTRASACNNVRVKFNGSAPSGGRKRRIVN